MTPNVFETDAFTSTSLAAAINELPFVPTQLTQSGLFANEKRLATTTVWVEFSGQGLDLLTVEPRGANGTHIGGNKRRAVPFKIPHIPARSEILADEIQDVRQFGSETALTNVNDLINERLLKMRNAIDYTIESHRIAAIKGLLIDDTGASVSLFTLFSLTQTTVNMALTTSTTKLRAKTAAIVSAIEAALKGRSYTGIDCYCGDTFFTSLVTHPDYEKTYINWNDAAQLRTNAYDTVMVGGIRFIRYRGTSAVKIADGEAYAVPTGVTDLFVPAFAPADYMEAVNTIALPYYAKSEAMPMNKGVWLEAQSNAINVNTVPDASVKLTAS